MASTKLGSDSSMQTPEKSTYEGRPPGVESPGRSYLAYASFSDPGGNGWLLQEITTRLPRRERED